MPHLYKSSDVGCPITGYELRDHTEGISIKYNSGFWMVIPDNIALHAIYKFKYLVSSSPTGDAAPFISTENTLVVGCTPDL